ncbi:1-deoxy-D-xylulose-5-phosphate synthase [bacterium (Candidatus Blackallbacteria) CG17_big_fil_post_rev_8_21_14_2_50_48_46]|uniref:1-deoxy-D-xylulose-5-phosphate synthase n=1 Tax=bacterium (Candidatus Blackallbacteria) CG17_big_fil_post_rev_8_21_14_2_50_48_46 TaxID=2014261 RepID=A0A2M7G456_9BACT|nr:MAG: 1-deoxy-D-xylulose-5-phosphate synthase [bacterium (Candidatus Blackallbacteria) CG18_big_fil_WC_8_21_14_2_50_49_26]PIW16668.1 MAG: 1-deoxy-D-xylulose-5-phosphate synthase [bacterium (Candidatus Blackallbacteria) CG17_big_fil_post_rev_8_21_14_2_50_48_46]PIW46174.1 MAG: 1-deoxy-D-xylulose-5-phosphate synthase [bacterium (Candidatus Blackallbacteria) CG13_big_fil_rev_8_21_14_2_50_49_14]
MKQFGTLTFFCGKMGAGKSTLAKVLAADKNAVLISEDEWLSAHYSGQIHTFDDYLKFSAGIKPFIKSHVQNILQTGTSVVMDFPANTVGQRKWFKQLCAEIGCEHELIFLDLSDRQCLSQIAKRRLEQPERASFDTEAIFTHVTRFFEEPSENEGLRMNRMAGNA